MCSLKMCDRLREGVSGMKWRLYALSVGIVLVVSPQYNLSSLLPSIGVKDAMGTTSVAVLEVVSVVTQFLYAPSVSIWGPKKSMAIGAIPSVIFTLACLYPRFWTMISAALLLGIGNGIIMPGMGAQTSSLYPSESRSHGARRKLNIGTFVIIYLSGKILVSLAPKYLLKRSDTPSLNVTVLHYNRSDMDTSKCGANDCPMEYIFRNHSEKFENMIPTDLSRMIYLGVFAVMQIVGVFVIYAAIPSRKSSVGHVEEQECLPLHSEKESIYSAFKKSMRNLKSLMFSKMSLCVIPGHIHYGLANGFFWSDIGRGYISCAFGVENLGLFWLLSNLAQLTITVMFQAIADHVSNPVLAILATLCEMSLFIFALLWQPSPDSFEMMYLAAILVGISFGSRKLTSYIFASVYFDDANSSFVVRSICVHGGVGLLYILTKFSCVYVKIYALSALSVLSTILAIIGHYRYA